MKLVEISCASKKGSLGTGTDNGRFVDRNAFFGQPPLFFDGNFVNFIKLQEGNH